MRAWVGGWVWYTSRAIAKRQDFSFDFSLHKNPVKHLVVWPHCIKLYDIHFPVYSVFDLVQKLQCILKLPMPTSSLF